MGYGFRDLSFLWLGGYHWVCVLLLYLDAGMGMERRVEGRKGEGFPIVLIHLYLLYTLLAVTYLIRD